MRFPGIEDFFPERSLSTAEKEKIKKQHTFSEKKKKINQKNMDLSLMFLSFNIFFHKYNQVFG